MTSQVDTKEGREWLRGLLRSEKVTITFTKKDGTERTMVCTLKEDKIPSEHAPKNTGKAQSEESCAVFDLENDGWRSFRWDSVKKIEFSLGE
jgi:predicted transcriptional regulator